MNLEAIFGPDGRLAKALPGFSWRKPQQEMAEQVAQALQERKVLIAEAGTGTGKTFAYLVPALLSSAKVIVSTGTRNLQDQLFFRDLPRLQAALGFQVRLALLKGRANYLCPYRLDLALLEARQHSEPIRRQLRKVQEWRVRTHEGDIAELNALPEEASVWPLVTSTVDNCLGSDCPELDRCYLLEARRKAQEADLVVVNHHLLCADFAIKQDGFGELLPAADAFVVDEAHQLPDVVSNFFGSSISTRQLLDLARDVRMEYLDAAGDVQDFLPRLERFEKAVKDFRLLFEGRAARGSWFQVIEDSTVQSVVGHMQEELAELAQMLAALAGRSKGLESCSVRAEKLHGEALQVCTLDDESDEEAAIHWFEVFGRSVRISRTPLDVAEVFRKQMNKYAGAWVFTSATLAVGESFEHFQRQLGLQDAQTARWESPFDYERQGLWFVPRGLPEPHHPEYTHEIMALALPILKASQGRAFLLFTSHRALRQAANWLEAHANFELLVQGSAPKAELLRRFVAHGHAVLLGTSSFWEGVDVRGEALSVVFIDKLPFASPSDPVLQARLEAIKKRGGNPFMHYQVPQAVIALKQGAGRLIRDVEDRGVLVVCDPRLLRRNKPYGKVFLSALPPFRRTRELSEVLAFLTEA